MDESSIGEVEELKYAATGGATVNMASVIPNPKLV
jgi:hypothetical protein